MRGPLKAETRAIATSSLIAQSGWLSPKRIAEFSEAHISGRRDHSRTLWQLLMLEKSLEKLAIGD